MMLYLLTIEGVYDQGCAGIYTDPQVAVEAARDLFSKSDRDHKIRVDEIPADTAIDASPTLRTGSQHAPQGYTEQTGVEFNEWKSQ